MRENRHRLATTMNLPLSMRALAHVDLVAPYSVLALNTIARSGDTTVPQLHGIIETFTMM
jgi:hypothetical protein